MAYSLELKKMIQADGFGPWQFGIGKPSCCWGGCCCCGGGGVVVVLELKDHDLT